MQSRISTPSRKIVAAPHGQAGFTLIELMVSLMLFLIVTGAIYGLLEVTRSDRTTTTQRVETMQSVRNALNTIGRDALNTGFKYRNLGSFFPDNVQNTVFGLAADSNTTPDRMMQILSGNNVNTDSLNPTAGYKTDQITFIYGDESFNNGKTLTVNWVDCDGEQVVVSWPTPGASPTPTPSIPAANDLMIITGQNSSAIGMVTSTSHSNPVATTYTGCAYTAPTGTVRTIKFDPTDLLGINKSGTANIIKNLSGMGASMSRVKLATYRVLNDGTLVRTEYGNFTGGKQDMPLAYNVEDLQIKYVLKDGSLSDDPAAGPDGVLGNADDTPTLMQDVRQVQIKVIVWSYEKDRRSGQNYKVTLTSTFNTRNIGYDPQ
ncbi:MAG: prepilin-type N-terminal cleavage/methylation domain-containing protein [Acidobacteria bacterium]|nr:prepilin-type N-terminal cleavage/methylation domain-containing protein [Acidobacteriota bacterium]